MVVSASAPTRVDLAGGTLDIFPLYVFEDGGITVNCAIELRSYVKIKTLKGKRLSLYSKDLKVRRTFKDISSLKLGGRLDFLVRIIKFYQPKVGLEITTFNTAPLGSGLGASSSLLIALSGALNYLNKNKLSKEQVIDIGANLEAQAIEIPTGKQDYYAAMYGGINAIWFNLDGNYLEPLVVSKRALKELEERIILSFTGVSHFSGTNNWNMLKAYIDKNGNTVKGMRRIKQTTLKMRDCLKNFDLPAMGKTLEEEWGNRKNLARGVTNARIDKLMLKAKKSGVLSSKICGAGGGGCMISLVKKGKREKVIETLKKNGAKVLDFKVARQGLVVRGERR
ncbi:MAG: hypothetical protein COS84_04985 [Armatimonadetes bacterium CG07_land_8_20_14_0_80_40_9]|nr:MAG: hypothetical protein COS84_04985 [Armatimonadetes bacterium CG07_land_8_20_14_0_80_40_9]